MTKLMNSSIVDIATSTANRIKDIRSINYETIAIIVPVKNNQYGLDTLLHIILHCILIEHLPKIIVAVDDNSDTCINIDSVRSALVDQRASSLVDVALVSCEIPGPGAAVNVGAYYAMERYPCIDWLLFVDSDCIFTS